MSAATLKSLFHPHYFTPLYIQVVPTDKGAESGEGAVAGEESGVTMVWGDDSSQEDKKEWESIPVDDQSNETSRCVHVWCSCCTLKCCLCISLYHSIVNSVSMVSFHWIVPLGSLAL